MPDNNKDEEASVQAFSEQMEELVEKVNTHLCFRDKLISIADLTMCKQHLVAAVFEALLVTGMPADAIIWVVQNRMLQQQCDALCSRPIEAKY
jgi:hypothetical protein